MKSGITFADRWHTSRDWGLELISVYIPMPAVKPQEIDIPGGDGSIDLTELGGRPVYADRDGIELIFYLINKDMSFWFLKQSEFARYVHGKKVKLVLDDEPDRYYMARLSLDGKKSNPCMGQITLSGTAEPFKYNQQSSLDEWLWDIFNFETGVIQTLAGIRITPTDNKVLICGDWIDNAPLFHVTESNNLRLVYGGKTYELKVGINRFPAVRIGSGETELVFAGNGELSIEYRGRCL